MKYAIVILFAASTVPLSAQVEVKLDFSVPTHAVSPYLYGRNNSLSGNPGSGFTPEWTKLKDARVRFFREGGGNNSTKYNWRRKLSSHP
ncbi:MAG TPA: glycoside hydrolase family 44, partial [Cyclobacteriaceae bacterium]